MNICVTGHRPDKLYGYNLNNYSWQSLRNKIARELIDNECRRFYTGMALGVDTIACMACLDVKKMGYKIDLIACIPFKGQENVWPRESQEQYHKLLDKCDEKVIVCDGGYAPYKMMRRNRYMVDNSDLVIAVWDGSEGGTANAVMYAERCGKIIINLLDQDDI